MVTFLYLLPAHAFIQGPFLRFLFYAWQSFPYLNILPNLKKEKISFINATSHILFLEDFINFYGSFFSRFSWDLYFLFNLWRQDWGSDKLERLEHGLGHRVLDWLESSRNDLVLYSLERVIWEAIASSATAAFSITDLVSGFYSDLFWLCIK